MKKKIMITSVAIAALIGYAGTTYYISQKEANEDQTLLQNIEALTDSENETQYIRQDGNCVYEYTGKAGGKIGLYAAGIKIAEITIGADGKATYTFEGKTDCAADGKQMCAPRYCPQLAFM